jgi:AAA family ATP:ADP antiporter
MTSPTSVLGASDSRKREGVRLFLMSVYLGLIIACYTATKAVRDSLFIVEIGPAQLPYLYIITAVSMALVSTAYAQSLLRVGLFSFVRITSLTAAGCLFLFWRLADYEGKVLFYVLYVWVSLFGAIAASQAWSVANQVYDAREARRSFARIGLGGVLGGIAGGSLARFVAPWKGTEVLLPICALLMVTTIGILHVVAREKDWAAPKEPPSLEHSSQPVLSIFREIRASPYLSSMTALLFAGVILEAFIDYEYKAVARQSFDSKDGLTSFFGTISSYGGMLALLVQTLLTAPLLKRFGVGAAILLLPSALLAGFLVVAARPALWAVSLLKLIDGALSYSVHRSGMELLYVPISEKLRAPVKAFIDLLADRAGRALGGLLLLLLTAGISLSIPMLSLIAASCLAVWLGIALVVRRGYIDAFRSVLERRVIEPESLDVRALDHATTRLLLQALSSDDDRQVLYALEVLSNARDARWHQSIPQLIRHRSPEVRRRTIALLNNRRVFFPKLIAGTLDDPELNVRIEAVRHLCAVDSTKAVSKLREFLVHEDYRIVLAAIHAMATYQLGDPALIDAALIERALNTQGEHGVSARTAAARALAITRLPHTPRFLDRLLEDASTEVVRQAIRSAGHIRHEDAIPRLITFLARPPLRRDAREALLKLGAPALSALRDHFQDEHTPLAVRARIPKVLSYSGSVEIAGFLLDQVHASTSHLDTQLLKALTRMRSFRPDIVFETPRVSMLIQEEAERFWRFHRIRRVLDPGNTDGGGSSGPVLSLMAKALDERLAESAERVLYLLALIYSPKDIQTVLFNLMAKRALEASAVELLDNLIHPQLRTLVTPILENRAKDGSKSAEEEMTRDEAIQILLSGDDEWLRTIARELAARLAVEGALTPRSA